MANPVEYLCKEEAQMIAGVDEGVLARVREAETAAYVAARPLAAGADPGPWLRRVPMHWMTDWPQPFPLVVARARGARLWDVDGHVLDDFCLGDTGSMFGHAPPPVARALARAGREGLTYMLPSAMAAEAGRLASEVFGDFRWQIALTATDANRYAIRVARAVTGRPKVLVFEGCYHGTVDDTMVGLDAGGRTVNRPGLVGQVQDLSRGAVVCAFNDLGGVEAALACGDVACILTEPVMTNSCMVLPDPGFLQGLQDLARAYGALVIIDETHTQSTGRGGYTRVHGLDPDMFVVGKCVAGGVPAALWGMRPGVAARFLEYDASREAGVSGMGTTLAGNPVQFACLVACLSEVATATAFARMDEGAAMLEAGLAAAITRARLPWHAVRVGARVEFICAPKPLKNGAEAALAHHPEVEGVVHMGLLNRGCLIAPFHNMMLVSPVTTRAQIRRLINAFSDVLESLTQ